MDAVEGKGRGGINEARKQLSSTLWEYIGRHAGKRRRKEREEESGARLSQRRNGERQKEEEED